MKTKKKKIGDAGIRLKPIEPNIFENYTKIMKKRKRKTKKKKKKKKKIDSSKSVEIHAKRDPLLDIINKKEPKEQSEQVDEPVFKKIKVQEGKRDISETDSSIKKLNITVSTEPEGNKKGHGIKLE